MTKPVSILSLNICADQISTFYSRFNTITNNILNIKPNIIFFQEAATIPLQRFTDTYHVISSCHTPIFEIYHYIPTIFLLFLSTCMYLFYNNYYLFMLAFISLPQVLLQCIMTLNYYLFNSYNFDWMGQTIFASKEHYTNIKLLEVTPFSYTYRGYIKPSQYYNIFLWISWWFRMLFIRPGFMIAKVYDNMNQEILLVSCHLVTGVTNINRMKQVELINNAIKKYNIKHVIWCGDFNADETQPEISMLAKYGYTDTCVKMNPIRLLDYYYTWENNINPYTPPGEPNQRVDYILYNDSFIAKKYTRIFDNINYPIVSDHYGIYTEFEMK
jgi:hypothetical protein